MCCVLCVGPYRLKAVSVYWNVRDVLCALCWSIPAEGSVGVGTFRLSVIGVAMATEQMTAPRGGVNS